MNAPAASGDPSATAARDTPSSHPGLLQTPWFAPAVFLATAGGLGRVPFAPGTFGALLGLPLAVVTGAIAERCGGGLAGRGVEAAIIAAICGVGIPICSRAARLMGRKDPGAIVLDEVASMPLALLVVPPEARSPMVLAVAFVLLRIFDIGKPFPCRQLEKLPAGLGIMADDWAAAAWTIACLAIARWQLWL
ncbi:MAG: phosphatidylglycerophosphatase A [Planctomycetia bacterium]|nr:phosphatidylglycerophosphatase A [Planctomycetia bacterium]